MNQNDITRTLTNRKLEPIVTGDRVRINGKKEHHSVLIKPHDEGTWDFVLEGRSHSVHILPNKRPLEYPNDIEVALDIAVANGLQL